METKHESLCRLQLFVLVIFTHGPNISVIQRKQRPYAEGNSFYYVTRHYVLLITSEQEKIVTGAWPKLKNGKEFIYPPDYFTENKVLKTIIYDSLNKPIDTVDNYILHKDKIYEKDDDRFLNISYRYYMEKDTILVLKTIRSLLMLVRMHFFVS